MRTELEALERWLAAERAELARFERYATLLGGMIVGAGLTGILLTLIMGCSEPTSPYWYDREDATDPEPMGTASDSGDLPEVPETDGGNTATETAGTGEADTATPDPTVDPEPTADPEPTVDPEPTADPEPTVEPDPTTAPESEDTGPADTGPDVPTGETEAPEPTADPDPTVEPEPTASDPEPYVSPTYLTFNGGKEIWRRVSDVNLNRNDLEIKCKGLIQWLTDGRNNWTAPYLQVLVPKIVVDTDPDAPCMCHFQWDPPDVCYWTHWEGPWWGSTGAHAVTCNAYYPNWPPGPHNDPRGDNTLYVSSAPNGDHRGMWCVSF